MILTLTRDYCGPDYNLGGLTVACIAFQTLELPWVPAPGLLCGHPDLSCVPAGIFDLVPHDSVKHPRTWALSNPALDVYPADAPPGKEGLCRTECLLHSGTFVTDSLGCILIGMGRRIIGGRQAIVDSRLALKKLQAILPWSPRPPFHTLEIS